MPDDDVFDLSGLDGLASLDLGDLNDPRVGGLNNPGNGLPPELAGLPPELLQALLGGGPALPPGFNDPSQLGGSPGNPAAFYPPGPPGGLYGPPMMPPNPYGGGLQFSAQPNWIRVSEVDPYHRGPKKFQSQNTVIVVRPNTQYQGTHVKINTSSYGGGLWYR